MEFYVFKCSLRTIVKLGVSDNLDLAIGLLIASGFTVCGVKDNKFGAKVSSSAENRTKYQH